MLPRYDAQKRLLVQDLASKSRDLMRRFYLVEKAKDANIVGIVVGTLGVAGYNEAIQRVRDIVAASGKKLMCLLVVATKYKTVKVLARAFSSHK